MIKTQIIKIPVHNWNNAFQEAFGIRCIALLILDIIDLNQSEGQASNEWPILYTHFPANSRDIINQSKGKRQTKDQSLAHTFPRIHAT